MTGLTGKRRARRRRRRTAGWNAGGLVAFGCSEVGQTGVGSTGLLIGQTAGQKGKEIAGIEGGGAISGVAKFGDGGRRKEDVIATSAVGADQWVLRVRERGRGSVDRVMLGSC